VLAIIQLVGICIAVALGLYLIVSERRRHHGVELENARLLADARIREHERARLSDRIITAEQDERRRLALFLHDGAVQNLSGIALMLDAAVQALDAGRLDTAREIVERASVSHRDTIRSLRDLSFNIEPVVLRDQGFVPAIRELARQLGTEHRIQVDVDAEHGDRLREREQIGLYQVIRESLNQAVHRGPPTRISVAIHDTGDGGLETVVADNGTGERRQAAIDTIAERVTTLNGRLTVTRGADGGTELHVLLPPYAADPEG
jgi:two-component system NarL family sensor kinase